MFTEFFLNFLDLSTVCLLADVVYQVDSRSDVTFVLLPEIPEVYAEQDEAQNCVQQVIDGESFRSDFCTSIEYSIMAGVYGAALSMHVLVIV